jgi:hypothetical protein
MANDPADILILVADDGNIYKIETSDWRNPAHQVTDEQTTGVINQLVNYGVVVADLPNDVAIADGFECKLINVGALKKLDQPGTGGTGGTGG